jgi:hypothetical protein
MRLENFRKAIEWYSGGQVVDVVNSDVGRKPAQHGRKLQMRASAHRGIMKRPIGALVPMRVFELMLYVEQPHAERSGNYDDGQEYEHNNAYAELGY